MERGIRSSLFALVLLLFAVPLVFAQTSRTTGALTGIVTDAQNNPLPGVTVTVSSPQLQGTRSEVSDANGAYTLPLLPPGQYTVTAELAGLRSVTRDNVTVSLNQTTKINLPMQLEVAETVTVTANQVVVDPTQTQTQTNFGQEHLQYGTVGASNRSYQNVLFQAAGTSTGSGGGSNPMVSGANVAQNDYVLDGINTTDPVTHTFGNNLPFNAIQEISIQTFGKDAEYGSSGGTVNVLTKSGTNKLAGVAEWHYRDTDLQEQGQATHPTGIPFFGGNATGSALNFNKDARPTMSSLPEIEVDGPLLRDRLWFMISADRPRTAVTNAALFGFQPGTREFHGWDGVAKLTFTPLENHTLIGKFINSYASIPFAQNSSFYSPEADSIQRQRNRTWGLTYDAIITSQWLVDFQAGHTPSALSVTPISGFNTPGTVDLATGITTGNYTGTQDRNSTRDEAVLSTTYYLENFVGTHSLKGGIDFNRTNFSSSNNSFGDPTQIPGFDPSFCSEAFGFPANATCAGFLELNPSGSVPRRINLSVVNPLHTVDSKDYAYFVQDQWNPISRLTLRLGVRYENIDWDSRSAVSPPSFEKWQPRFGVAYDIFNNARSVVHGFAGTIMDQNQLTLPSYGVAQPSGSAFFNFNTTTGRYQFDPANSFIFLTGEQYDPDLKPSYSNEYSVGWRQLIWRNTSLDITGEYRTQKGLFEDYCGTLDNPLPACVITNQPGFDVGVTNALRARYRAIVTQVESRAYQWLDVIASWTHGRSEGSYGSSFTETQNASAFFDFYPVHFTNTYGYLSDDARNRVKVNGFVHLPLQFTVGANYYWDDGTPWSVTQSIAPYGTAFLEPRGSRRLPDYSQTDLSLEKRFQVGPTQLSLIGVVYNVFNSETAIAINGNAGVRAITDPNTGRLFVNTDPNFNNTGQPYQLVGPNRINATFGQPTAWQQPRRYEAAFRVSF
ncbi:MAG: TonB-dependent receptor [Acidobacteria bacterium]|nr:TonB-dependent receptor [Acidobacteriota bacterium]